MPKDDEETLLTCPVCGGTVFDWTDDATQTDYDAVDHDAYYFECIKCKTGLFIPKESADEHGWDFDGYDEDEEDDS